MPSPSFGSEHVDVQLKSIPASMIPISLHLQNEDVSQFFATRCAQHFCKVDEVAGGASQFGVRRDADGGQQCLRVNSAIGFTKFFL